MFEAILDHLLRSGQIHERQAHDARIFIEILERQNETAPERLIAALETFNYEQFSPEEGTDCFPNVEFFRGIDDYATSIGINWDGSSDVGELVIDGNYSLSQKPDFKRVSDAETVEIAARRRAVNIDLARFPVSRIGLFEFLEQEEAFYLAWLAAIWQKIDGNDRCGMKVNTLQNNSVARFSLNDFLHDDFSAFLESDYGPKPPRIGPFFPRKLTIEELFLRASQKNYAHHPFKNYWRYFEKDGRFMEIVAWDNATGVRDGDFSEKMTASVSQIEQHESSNKALRRLTNFVDKAIFDGWEEKLRPIGLPEKMHDRAFDFGEAFFTENQEKRPSLDQIKTFEKNHGLRFPPAFEEFFLRFSGKKPLHELFYPIDDIRSVNVKRFFSLLELYSKAVGVMKNAPGFLPIGELENGEFLAICALEQSRGFGKIAIIRAGGVVEVGDYSFEKCARWAHSWMVQPEIFAAQENDTAFLKKRLAEGWQPATVYRYQRAIEVAAENNAHDALEVLLQAGERVRNENYRQATWVYDATTIAILSKYQ